jgi:Na+/H+-dicarboxylate symporter
LFQRLPGELRRVIDLYKRLPLFLKIIVASVLGAVLGPVLGNGAAHLKPFSDLILQLLRLLASPLIFLSIVHSILSAEIKGKAVGRLAGVLLSNTVIAICIGLVLANEIQPGLHVHFPSPSVAIDKKPFDLAADLLGRVPKDFVSPFASNDLIGIILIGLAVAVGLRTLRNPTTEGRISAIATYVEPGLQLVLRLLSWVLEVVPSRCWSPSPELWVRPDSNRSLTWLRSLER